MENLEIYVYLSILVSAIAAYVTARYGRKHYNKALAGSFFVVAVVTVLTIESLHGLGLINNYITWIAILAITVVLFIFSRIGTYVVAWFGFTVIVGAVLVLVGMEMGLEALGFMSLAGIVITILFRKHLITITVGLLSAYFIVLILTEVIFLVDPAAAVAQLSESWSLLQLASLALLAFGVYFQYALHEKVFGAKKAPAEVSGTEE
jgi:MFS family permease